MILYEVTYTKLGSHDFFPEPKVALTKDLIYIRRLPSLKIIIQLYNGLEPSVSHGSGGNKPENPFSRTTRQHNVHERRTAD